MEIALQYRPHAGQQSIHDDRRRFRVVCAGRRWGKTRFAAAELIDRAGHEAPGDYGWIAPTYLIAERGVDACKTIAPDLLTFSGRSPTQAALRGLNGPIRIWFLTADNPDSILGFGFKGLILDEAARIPHEVWTRYIRPTLSDSQGWAVFISTPLGRNWFFDEYTRGRGEDPLRRSWSFPSNTSPYLPPGEWEEARASLPEDVFKQEYMAEFLEDSAGAFRGIEACLLPDDAPLPARPLLGVGCDIAKHTDWTVLIAMDRKTGRCLAMDRFNHLDWPIQKDRIIAFMRRWPGKLVIDATGAGDPIYDDLVRRYPHIEPFRFTAASKPPLIQKLAVALEQGQVRWPRSWAVLTDELKRYEYEIHPGGRISYDAPSGFHDDCVAALALANETRSPELSAAPMIPFTAPHPALKLRVLPRSLC